jgi:hypothetical protein
VGIVVRATAAIVVDIVAVAKWYYRHNRRNSGGSRHSRSIVAGAAVEIVAGAIVAIVAGTIAAIQAKRKRTESDLFWIGL